MFSRPQLIIHFMYSFILSSIHFISSNSFLLFCAVQPCIQRLFVIHPPVHLREASLSSDFLCPPHGASVKTLLFNTCRISKLHYESPSSCQVMIYRFVTRASVEERITQVRSAVHYNKCKGKYLFKRLNKVQSVPAIADTI